MIQVALVNDVKAGHYAAKRGFIVLCIEKDIARSVDKAGGTFVMFGKKVEGISVVYKNPVDAISKMVESSDLVLLGKGSLAELTKNIAELKNKPHVEGEGQNLVEKAAEKLIRFNLFGKKD